MAAIEDAGSDEAVDTLIAACLVHPFGWPSPSLR